MDKHTPDNLHKADRYNYTNTQHSKEAGIPFYRRIFWGAIIAGTLVSLVCMMVLNLLGIGIGLSATSTMEEVSPFSGLGTGAIVWWVVSNLIAIFAGGYVAGRLAGVPLESTSILHGLLSWCLYTLVSFWILTSAVGSLISGVGTIVSGTLSVTASGVETYLPEQEETPLPARELVSMSEIRSEVNQVLRTAEEDEATEEASNDAQESDRLNMSNEEYLPGEELNEIAEDVFYRGDQLSDNIDRQDLALLIQNRTNLSKQDSRNVANVIVRKHRELKRELNQLEEEASQKAEEANLQAAESAASAAIWTFAALVLGAVMACIGGRTGKPGSILPDALHTPKPKL